MDIMEFLKTRRTYRRFEQKPVEPAIAREIMEAARIASCGANRQTLKYVLVQSPEMVAKMQPLVHWAAYLPPEQGQPKPDETPVLFVAVCQDESLPGCNDTDTGLALANMTDAAWAHGVGSCIMGAIDRPAIKELLGLGENLRLHSVVAFGYPTHKSHLVAMQNGNVKYYLDDARDYCVPKRPMVAVVVHQAAGGGNHDLAAGFQLFLLLFQPGTAVHAHHADLRQELRQVSQILCNLLCQLTRGAEHNGLGRTCRETSGLLQNGNAERNGFAGAGGGLGNHIMPGQHQGNGLLLDFGHLGISHCLCCPDDLRPHGGRKFSEVHKLVYTFRVG